MARGRSDIANTAVRIFLQEMGVVHDKERGLEPYVQSRDFSSVKEFFGNRCCYCDVPFDGTVAAVQDHLIPMNKTDIGLHCWGNIVPACRDCNAKKQGGDWRAFIIERAGAHAAERHQRVQEFLKKYQYKPTRDVRTVAEELYDEIGGISMTLIQSKIRRLSDSA